MVVNQFILAFEQFIYKIKTTSAFNYSTSANMFNYTIRKPEVSAIITNKNIFTEKFNDFYKNRVPFIFMIDFDLNNFMAEKISDAYNMGITFNFCGIKNQPDTFVHKDETISVHPPAYDEYTKSFNIVRKNIAEGNTYLTNLTFESEIFTKLTLEEIFHKSKTKYKMKYKNNFVFFSPETFIKISDGYIHTYPMKGTVEADNPGAARILLEDEKEKAEHLTIVDLMRNDLNMISSEVKINKFRFLSEINTKNKKLLHTSSEIVGRMTDHYATSPGDAILRLLPAGSICGAPKKKTLEIIRDAENYQRGFYTGVAGIFDGENIDSCVMIRFIESHSGKMFYKSGGGITAYSEPEKEYKELLNKIYVPVN